jgi:sodium/hydrogen exchanger-like protein 6/7/sodium/hydrogen exchanger 8
MCASDAVAALTMIKADQYPKLFSVVFGEGMINDAVAIIIFTSVTKLTNDAGTEFSNGVFLYSSILMVHSLRIVWLVPL